VVAKPPKVLNPPVAPSPASASPGVTDEIAVNKFNIQVASEDAELFTIFLPLSFTKVR